MCSHNVERREQHEVTLKGPSLTVDAAAVAVILGMATSVGGSTKMHYIINRMGLLP